MLGIVYRAIATHLIHKAGYTKTTVQTSPVTLIQRFGGALNVHFHMLFLDGVYIDSADRSRARVTPAQRGKGKKAKTPQGAPDQTSAEHHVAMTWLLSHIPVLRGTGAS
jgi:hypothetical protein